MRKYLNVLCFFASIAGIVYYSGWVAAIAVVVACECRERMSNKKH